MGMPHRNTGAVSRRGLGAGQAGILCALRELSPSFPSRVREALSHWWPELGWRKWPGGRRVIRGLSLVPLPHASVCSSPSLLFQQTLTKALSLF